MCTVDQKSDREFKKLICNYVCSYSYHAGKVVSLAMDDQIYIQGENVLNFNRKK